MVVYGGWNTAFIEHGYVLNTDSWRWTLKRVKDDGVSVRGRAVAWPGGHGQRGQGDVIN